MLAYKNDSSLKERTVADAVRHAQEDHLLSGLYYKNGSDDWKGCSVGCFTKDGEGGHKKYPELLGLPVWLAHLQDSIFENLDAAHRHWWHTSLFDAIPVGADLEPCRPAIIYWTLTEGIERPTDPKILADWEKWGTLKALDDMAALHLRWMKGDRPSDAEFNACSAEAAEAAWAAGAAEAAGAAGAAGAAEAAGAAWAARAAGATWAAGAARAAFYKRMADQVLVLLASAIVPDKGWGAA